MAPLSNSWHNLTDTQWLVMALAIAAGVAITVFAEWLSRPRASKWSDWRNRR